MKRKKGSQRNLRREGLEVYLLYLLMSYRPILLIFGLLLLFYAISVTSYSISAGSISLILAILLFLAATTNQTTLYLAKLGAWMGTLRKKKDHYD